MAPARLPDPPVLLITDRSQARAPLGEVVAAACAGGVRWISLREKDLGEAEQKDLLADLKKTAAPFGARVLLHGSAELAMAAGADGVHLPANGDAAAARALLGPEALIGQSVHGPDEAARAVPGMVDYVVAGPAFLTQSKPGYGPALEPAGLARLAGLCKVPLLALGGIEPSNVAVCRSAGVAGIAVMGGVMRASRPDEEARRLLAAWAGAAPAG
ncbi:thiamine phosphate synthase [Aquabacter sp. L1I39]|uniref:thiamine phosphate synthase n=1 Tax=Aquabacter sp. L1I39 TaxID=2820278 RepID=UPI001ADA05E1|nr:thiamine phosphate synthase [Aquabacter sp. L1I39]QTL01846.1 thiamine phosphate synthase [Aquabacter sp. L1I39]